MTNDALAQVIEGSRKILSGVIPTDDYLSGIAAKYPSHRFLGNCTQAVYLRQTKFLGTILRAHTGCTASDIRILDWGCGKGHITYALQEHGFSVVASDMQDASDDSAFGQETPIIHERAIEVVPLTESVELPFPDSTFDCVTSFGVLEHVQNDLESLREIRRILKPGGLLYISFLPYPLSWTQALARVRGNNYHDRLYWRRQLRELSDSTQLEIRAIWLSQLFPKNSIPLSLDHVLEPIDRALCRYTPLKYFATNLEAILIAK